MIVQSVFVLKTVEISNNILNKMSSALNYFSVKLNTQRFFSSFRCPQDMSFYNKKPLLQKLYFTLPKIEKKF